MRLKRKRKPLRSNDLTTTGEHMKQYRVYLDIEAENLNNAIQIADEMTLEGIREDETITNVFNTVPYPFDKQEELTVYEAAIIAFADSEIFDMLADKMDMTDEDMVNLREKLTEYMK